MEASGEKKHDAQFCTKNSVKNCAMREKKSLQHQSLFSLRLTGSHANTHQHKHYATCFMLTHTFLYMSYVEKALFIS